MANSSPEIKSALLIVAGIWASDLKDIPQSRRKAALRKWAERHDIIYEYLKEKYENQ